MICYRDRWWCTFYKDCVHKEECDRPLTDDVMKKAMKWWDSFESDDPIPIDVTFEKPPCWENKKDGF